jgi:rhodanese-related sulfurtransferase
MMPLSETGSLGAPGALVAALALGCAFGWCLERAGLASAPKLAGQFYLTDFSVFKVMFSALLTAMLGAYWLDQLGLLDLNLVYLPETYVVPQAIGGILFGAGFLVAGLCPGTSCVAAATGRGDGLAVIGGLLFGVFMFNMSYSQVENLYNSTALGAVTLHGWIGMSPGLAIALLVVLALAGFALAERLVPSPSVHPHAEPVRTIAIHRAMVLIAVVLASAAATRDVRRTDARTLATEIQNERDHISAPDLADLIIGGDATLRVFDLRSAADFEQMHIPGARHMTIDTLARQPLPRDATIVLYSEGGAHAAQAWVLLRMRGYARVLFLREGLYEWLARVMEPRLAIDATESERADFVRAVERSRFFGGLPRDRVPRADVLTGYWTTGSSAGSAEATHAATAPTQQMVARIRRRGC